MGGLNWKLIVGLSSFGAVMAIATVFLIPSNVEPLFWLVIFAICAVVIARRCSGRHFLHGLAVSVVNSVWITAGHVVLFDAYISRHPQEAAMASGMPLPARLMMLLTGPVVGVVSGVVLGLFAFVASKFIKPQPA